MSSANRTASDSVLPYQFVTGARNFQVMEFDSKKGGNLLKMRQRWLSRDSKDRQRSACCYENALDDHQTMKREITQLSARRECGNVRLMTAAQVYAISTRGDKTVAASYATVENSLYKRRRLHQSTLSSSTDEVADTIENSRCARPRNVL